MYMESTAEPTHSLTGRRIDAWSGSPPNPAGSPADTSCVSHDDDSGNLQLFVALGIPTRHGSGGTEGGIAPPDLRVAYAAIGVAEVLAVFAIYGLSLIHI